MGRGHTNQCLRHPRHCFSLSPGNLVVAILGLKRGGQGAIWEEIESRIQEAAAVLKAAGAREVYVFGSAAKGRLRGNSDVDLAVCGLPAEVFSRAMAAAHNALGRPLDLVDLDEDNPFTRHLKEEGELRRVG